MKNIFGTFFLSFHLLQSCNRLSLPLTLPTGDSIISSKNYIIWGTTNLSWNDFKGPKRSKKFGAGTFGGISYARNENNKWLVFAYFDKTLSWFRIADTTALVHEKYHFNIVEIFARKVRKDLTEKKIILDSTNNFRFYLQNIWQEVENMQKHYDEETDFSRNADQQNKWQHKIDEKIDSLKEFESILIN